MKAYYAKSATGIVMDPWTGEIYAIANVPDYDPAHYAKATDDARRDRAVEDAYEPGSTFKLITAAAAIGSGKVTAKSRFPARDALQIGGNVIHNAEDGFMAGTGGTESLEDIIAYSHNVGAAEVGMALGKQTLYDTIRNFGFGDPTEVGLPGENPGIVPAARRLVGFDDRDDLVRPRRVGDPDRADPRLRCHRKRRHARSPAHPQGDSRP